MMGEKKLFCFGFGFCAAALARLLAPQAFRIAGTCRTQERAHELKARGIEAYLFSDRHPLTPEALEGATHVLASVPPEPDGDPVLAHAWSDLLQAAPHLEWAGYLSTTGVYGDRGGGWVNEQSSLEPSTDRGERRLRAERGWLAYGVDTGVPVHLFRLAGIYGPGRTQFRAVADGTAKRVIKPGQVFSRIHVDDVAAILAASIAQPRANAAYNVCDDEPAPPQDIIAFCAGLLGLPVPPGTPFGEAVLSPMARSFFAENKRVSNRLIREELGVTLKYPTYREGLRALYESGDY
ncbi:MAG: SDR family oxidoreductase [Parvibaculaceae bacterium]|nr:SDR family oxidoreductase [Parvibaculaceae bacterium]